MIVACRVGREDGVKGNGKTEQRIVGGRCGGAEKRRWVGCGWGGKTKNEKIRIRVERRENYTPYRFFAVCGGGGTSDREKRER